MYYGTHEIVASVWLPGEETVYVWNAERETARIEDAAQIKQIKRLSQSIDSGD